MSAHPTPLVHLLTLLRGETFTLPRGDPPWKKFVVVVGVEALEREKDPSLRIDDSHGNSFTIRQVAMLNAGSFFVRTVKAEVGAEAGKGVSLGSK